MFRFVSIGLLLSFILWIVPLGVFIKPSQEKISCGGQRAICLCRHLDAHGQQKTAGKISFQNSGSAPKDQGPSGSASHFFLAADLHKQVMSTAASATGENILPQLNPFFKSIEHIPKA